MHVQRTSRSRRPPAGLTGDGQAPSVGPPGSGDDRSDGALASLAAEGDREAAGELIDRYQATVRRFLLRLTGRADIADDLAQDTFVRMLRYADRFDDRHSMRTWLLTIARRLSINRGRRESRRQSVEGFPFLVGREADPADAAIAGDERRLLRTRLAAAMSVLTESQRQAIALFHEQGLSVDEAASVMGLPTGTVKSHLHRGRAALRRVLGAAAPEGKKR